MLCGALTVNGFSRFVTSGLSARAAGRGAARAGGDDELGGHRRRRRRDVPGRQLHAGAALDRSAPATPPRPRSSYWWPSRSQSRWCCRCASARGCWVPTTPRCDGSAFYAVATGWAYGLRAVRATPSVAATLSGLAAHRMVFGINTLLVLVIVRHTGADGIRRAGHRGGVRRRHRQRRLPGQRADARRRCGGGAATPPPTPRCCAPRSSSSRARRLQLAVMVVCGFFLGLAGQMVKLCADTAMQIDVDDALRGHVFAVQDALFWMSFIAAISAAAAVIPADGHSHGAGAGRFGGLPGRAGRARGHRPAPRAGELGSAAMAAAGSTIVDDLRAESEALDALVAGLPAEQLGAADAGARVDDRPPDRASAVDRPGGADVDHRRGGVRRPRRRRASRHRHLRRRRRRRTARPLPPPHLLADWRRPAHELHAALRDRARRPQAAVVRPADECGVDGDRAADGDLGARPGRGRRPGRARCRRRRG